MNRTLNGRYRIDDKVGDGGMAVVYRGWDTVLNRVVAIKVLREQYAVNQQFLARFRREAQAAAGLAHPNIVNVYDVGRDSDTWYIVQELIDGTDLATMIRQQGQFSVPQATEVMAQVCAALDYAHSKGIIHRDVKPHNILIDSRGTAKVVDFGIAKGVNDVTMTDAGTALGTAGYISPEQATGSPLTPASDLYSSGVVLYEMLTGRLPFIGDTAVSVAMQHVRNPPPPPTRFNARIPRPVEQVILRALEKMPDRRFASGDEFVAALRAAGVPGAVAAVPVATAVGGATRVIPEGTRPIVSDPPRSRTAVAPPGRNGTRHVNPMPAAPPPPRTSGPGIGTWLLGGLLLVGLLALVYFGFKLLNANGGPPSVTSVPPTQAVAATGSAAAATTTRAAGSATAAAPSVAVTPTRDPNAIEVPNLSGLFQPQAADELQKRGLGLGKETMRNSDQVPRGQILDQDPKPGAIVAKGGQINIVTSLGPAIVDLSGLSLTVKGKAYDEVAKQLTDLGLKPSQQTELSADVDAGKVTRIDPADKVPAQGNVTVYVSSGKPTATPAPATVTATPGRTTTTPNAQPSPRTTPSAGVGSLPSVIGKSPDEAKSILTSAGFTNVEVSAVSSLPGGIPKAKKGTIAAVYAAQPDGPKPVSAGDRLPKDITLILIPESRD